MEKLLSVLDVTLTIVITFGLAVFVHEFGHMMFALIRGVGVESFAIGMGPKITSWKWHGIDFSLRWFPVGGFVKLEGRKAPATEAAAEGGQGPSVEAVPAREASPAEEPANDKTLTESSYDDLYALQDKGFLTKVLVFGGGVFMNFVTAVVCIALMLIIGIKVELFGTKIEKVDPASTLAKEGVRAGDVMVALGATSVSHLNDVEKTLAKKFRSEAKEKDAHGEAVLKTTLTVRRGTDKTTLPLAPMTLKDAGDFMVELNDAIWRPAYVRDVLPNFPAERAGVKSGDVIIAVDGHPVDSYTKMAELINARLEKPTALKITRQGQTLDLTVTPRAGIAGLGSQDPKKGYIGIVPGSPEQMTDREPNPFLALVQAVDQAQLRVRDMAMQNAQFIKNATFKQLRENVAGPIGIAVFTAKMAKRGWDYKVNWFITLNLLLMMFNLLPLPVLDGGFILLAAIEGIIRRPVPPKVLGPVYTVFVVGFIILMVLISVQDFLNVFTTH